MAFTPIRIKNIEIPPEPDIIDPVIIIPGIMGSAYKNGEWIIDPIFHVYDNLIETLAANGYEHRVKLFTLPYDWRNSNVETAELLKNKIKDVKEICACGQVDIVAHSMGGLVARQYAQSAEYGNDIDQLIFLGTPHRGAPKDYLTWEAGEFAPGIRENFVKSHYNKEAKRFGYNNLFDYIHEWPITSVRQLLPTFNYLVNATSDLLANYPNGYPENDFLVELNQGLVSFLASSIDITNIIGNTGNNTISNIRVTNEDRLPLWQHGYPEDYDSNPTSGLRQEVGDGTVPKQSAELGGSFDMEIASGHANLPTDAEEEIYEIIHGGDLSSSVKRAIPLRILFAKIFSPADIMIIAPDGKKVGKDFTTGQEINEIPGAFYSRFDTDDEYITIPDPLEGEYKIEVKGSGNGFYELELSSISDGNTVDSSFTGYIVPDLTSEIIFDIDETVINEPIKTVTLESIIKDINMLYDLGLITDKKIRDGLVKQIKAVIKFEKKRNGKYEKKVDKILLKLFEKELDFLLKKEKIKQEAYNIIKENLNWLITNN